MNKKQHKHSPYKDIPSSRLREGFYIKSTDTLLLANHLENHLLPSQGDPDCFVVCESVALTDFIRTFKNRGYKIIVVDEIGKFESFKKRMGVEEKHLLPDIYTSSSSKIGLDAYLNHCIDFIIEEMPFLHLKESLARKLVELVAQLSRREGNPTLTAPFLVTPSLKDVASLALNERETKEGKLSYELLSTIFLNPEKEPAFNKIANGESVPAFEENYHYKTTPIYSIIKQLRSKFLDNFASCHERSFSVFQREEGKVVYLFPFDDENIKRQHLFATIHMLIDKMAISPPITKSDIWLFTPDYFNFMNSQGIPSFDFRALNKANINLFMFGDGNTPLDVFDTLIDVKGEQIVFEDNRAKFLFESA